MHGIQLVGVTTALLLCSGVDAAAATFIREFDDHLLVEVIGSPEPATAQTPQPAQPPQPAQQSTRQPVEEDHTLPGSENERDPAQQADLKAAREEAGRLRLPIPGETPEQSLERRTRAAEAQARLRALEQQLKPAQK
jgi:hypothetical protein